jgi:hypothetical protein
MTRDELAALIITNLNDSGVFNTLEEVNDAIQDGYEDLVLTHGLRPKATAINIAANKVFYDMPTIIPDFVALRAIYFSSNKRWLTSQPLKYLQSCRDDWELTTGNPTDYWVANYRRVALFPHPTSSSVDTLWIFYYASAPTLTLSAQDLNIPVDSGFRALENYATSVLLTKAEEWSKAEAYEAQAQEDSEECKLFRNYLKSPDYQDGLRGSY